MTKPEPFRKSFILLLILKAIYASLQLIFGILLLFINKAMINTVVSTAFQEELLEQPNDFLANKIMGFATNLSVSTQLFLGVYFLIHSLVKLGLLYGIYKRKLFVYPFAAWVFFLFLSYEIYQYFLTYSVWLLALSMLDLLFIYLLMKEYRILKGKNN